MLWRSLLENAADKTLPSTRRAAIRQFLIFAETLSACFVPPSVFAALPQPVAERKQQSALEQMLAQLAVSRQLPEAGGRRRARLTLDQKALNLEGSVPFCHMRLSLSRKSRSGESEDVISPESRR